MTHILYLGYAYIYICIYICIISYPIKFNGTICRWVPSDLRKNSEIKKRHRPLEAENSWSLDMGKNKTLESFVAMLN